MKQQAMTKQKLLGLEERYWNAIMQKDSATAASLSDDTCVVVGAQGVGEVDRGALAMMLESAKYTLEAYSLEDVHMHRVSDEVVTLAYKVKEALTVDGKKVNLEAFDSSVWVKWGSNWVCVVHTESLAGDPFGRH
jgi:hypothetical protein